MIDSVSVRAVKGALSGPSPVDRGKPRSKIHLIVDCVGPPLAVGISTANAHDNQALQPLVRSIPPIRLRRGPRWRRPGKLHGDKGEAYAHLRGFLRKRGITARIAYRDTESSQRLDRHRWGVERTVSWLGGFRRRHRHYERKPKHFLQYPPGTTMHGRRDARLHAHLDQALTEVFPVDSHAIRGSYSSHQR